MNVTAGRFISIFDLYDTVQTLLSTPDLSTGHSRAGDAHLSGVLDFAFHSWVRLVFNFSVSMFALCTLISRAYCLFTYISLAKSKARIYSNFSPRIWFRNYHNIRIYVYTSFTHDCENGTRDALAHNACTSCLVVPTPIRVCLSMIECEWVTPIGLWVGHSTCIFSVKHLKFDSIW